MGNPKSNGATIGLVTIKLAGFAPVPLTAIIGWLVYSEAIDIYTAAGAALILIGNLLNLKKPDKQVRQQT